MIKRVVSLVISVIMALILSGVVYAEKGYTFNQPEGNQRLSNNITEHVDSDNIWTDPYGEFIITYDLNDTGSSVRAENSPNNPSTYSDKDTITLYHPTRKGYEFIGWTGSNGSVPELNVTIPLNSTGDKHYTANWREIAATPIRIKHNGIQKYTGGVNSIKTQSNPIEQLIRGLTQLKNAITGNDYATWGYPNLEIAGTEQIISVGARFKGTYDSRNRIEYNTGRVPNNVVVNQFNGGLEFRVNSLNNIQYITNLDWENLLRSIRFTTYDDIDNGGVNIDFIVKVAGTDNAGSNGNGNGNGGTGGQVPEQSLKGILDVDKFRQLAQNLTGTIKFESTAYRGDLNQPNVMDISQEQNKSIICVIAGQDATIYGDGGVIAPQDSSDLFSSFSANRLHLSGLNTSHVTNMTNMFYAAKAVYIDISGFNTSNVVSMNSMFMLCEASEINGIVVLNTSKVQDMAYMFAGAQVKDINVSNFNTSNVMDMQSMFNACLVTNITGLNNFDTRNVVDMQYMFLGVNVTSLDVSSFDTSKVTSMNSMFMGCTATNIIGLENFNTQKVTDMCRMFYGAYFSRIDVSSFDTSNVTDMAGMFCGVKAQSISIIGLTGFNTSKVTTMNSMFSLVNTATLDLSSFDLSNVNDTNFMFANASINTVWCRTQVDLEKMLGSKLNGLTKNNFKVK